MGDNIPVRPGGLWRRKGFTVISVCRRCLQRASRAPTCCRFILTLLFSDREVEPVFRTVLDAPSGERGRPGRPRCFTQQIWDLVQPVCCLLSLVAGGFWVESWLAVLVLTGLGAT